MKDSNAVHAPVLVVEHHQPVVAIPVTKDGPEMVYYSVEAAEYKQGAHPKAVQDALGLAGAWSDIDWDEAVDVLDGIRHESKPTPPLESIAE
jgi:predicted transcriptional regulator